MDLDAHGSRRFKLHLQLVFKSCPGKDSKVEAWNPGVGENGGQRDKQASTETGSDSW